MNKETEKHFKDLENKAMCIRHQMLIQKSLIIIESDKTYRKEDYYFKRRNREYKNLNIMKVNLNKLLKEIQIINYREEKKYERN